MTNIKLTKLIAKYSIILIVFEILTHFGLNFGLQFYYEFFPVDGVTNFNRLKFSLVTSAISILMNLILAFIMLYDADKERRLTWIIFALTLFSPRTGTIIFIITKMIEMRDNNITGDHLV